LWLSHCRCRRHDHSRSHEWAALLFDPLDPEAIARAIHIGLSEPELTAHLVERGRQQLCRFDWRHIVADTIRVYEEARGRKLNPPSQSHQAGAAEQKHRPGPHDALPCSQRSAPSPPGKTGWPWTEETSRLPEKMSDGRPWPRISIVTPSYNQGQFIEETIRSVLLQGYPNLEYIVIDGGSSDGSVEILQEYEQWLAYWVSERDRGQADALNKGFRRASGILSAT